MDDFLVRAFVAGIGVALVAAPLGSFVVWRRMSYFGDTMAHSALLGVALGYILGVDLYVGIIAVCGMVALFLVGLKRRRDMTSDTALGILSHGALALGLVAVSLLEAGRIDLMGYLFGDILAVSAVDILVIYGGGLAVAAVVAAIWRPLLSATVHEELAIVEGMPVVQVQFVFMLLLAVAIAISMKVVGILLVTSLIIIPAAAARPLARSPEQMVTLAAVVGVVAVSGGLWGSFAFDTPSGPSIVAAALLLFAASLAAPHLSGRR